MYYVPGKVSVGIFHGREETLLRVSSSSSEAAVNAALDRGEYRWAGTLHLNADECAPDRALELAYARSQNRDEPWRVGERSTMPGDVFWVGRSRWVVRPCGFESLTDKAEELAHVTQSLEDASHWWIEFSNRGDADERRRCGHQGTPTSLSRLINHIKATGGELLTVTDETTGPTVNNVRRVA